MSGDIVETCKELTNITFPGEIDTFEQYLLHGISSVMTEHGVTSLFGFVEWIINNVIEYPGGIASDMILPPSMCNDPNIAAFVLLIIHLHGWKNYTITREERVYYIEDPDRITTVDLATEISKICVRQVNLHEFPLTKRSVYIAEIECNNGVFNMVFLQGILYVAKRLRAELMKLGMSSTNILEDKFVLIGEDSNGIVLRITLEHVTPDETMLPGESFWNQIPCF